MRAKVVAVVLMGLAGAGARAADEPAIPREGSGSTMAVGNATMKVLAQVPGRIQFTWEFLGLSISDDGKGIFHNCSVRCLGASQLAGDAYQSYENSCTYTRPDGDQIFGVEQATRTPNGTKGTTTFVGGTGKMAGITGSSEWVRYWVRPAAEGTLQTMTKGRGSYKLP